MYVLQSVTKALALCDAYKATCHGVRYGACCARSRECSSKGGGGYGGCSRRGFRGSSRGPEVTRECVMRIVVGVGVLS